MALKIEPLSRHARHLPFVAGLVYREFWVGVRDGYSEADLVAAFGAATDPARVLLSLVALDGRTPVGCVHLIANDDDTLPELYPWLAALVVVPERRGQGIGSALVQAIAREAAAMGFAQLWFGTDGPGFYERLGAVKHLQRGADFWIMKLPLR